jgi:hypothetical protein
MVINAYRTKQTNWLISYQHLNKLLIKLDTNKQLLLTFFAKTSMNVSWRVKKDKGNFTFAPPN